MTGSPRFLSDHGLFLLLLGGSCLGHWSLTQWKEKNTIHIELHDREYGRTSIAIQLVAAKPKEENEAVELIKELKEPVETTEEEQARIRPRNLPVKKTERTGDEVVARHQPLTNTPLVPQLTAPSLEAEEVEKEKPLPKNEPPRKPMPKQVAKIKLPELENIEFETSVTLITQQSSGIDVPPRAATRPDPIYPPDLRQRGIGGELKLSVTIGADGTAKTVAVLESSGYPAMDESAVTAVRRTRFNPALKDGKPVEQTVIMPFGFSIRNRS